MEIKVRQASPVEALALAALQRRTALLAYASIFPAEAPKPQLDQLTADWERRLGGSHGPNACGFVAEVPGNPMAGAVVGSGDPDDVSFGHITRLYVDPKVWGNGVGRSLYEAVISHLSSSGYPRASLWVLEGNVRARHWYERLGWICTGQRKSVLESARIDDLRYIRIFCFSLTCLTLHGANMPSYAGLGL